jgi:hypothetical protein
MNSPVYVLLSLLPLVLIPAWYAVLLKVAALILRRAKLGWKHALVLGVLGSAVGLIGTVANMAAGFVIPTLVGVLLGTALQAAVGGWYLRSRATTATGTPFRFSQGALLSSMAAGMGILCAVAVVMFVPVSAS